MERIKQLPRAALLMILMLLSLSACSQTANDDTGPASSSGTSQSDGPSPAVTSSDAKESADADTQHINSDGKLAVLEGRALFQGFVPPPREISVTKDVEYCSAHVGERREVVVSQSGGLASVVVEIRGIDEPSEGWKWQHPAKRYQLHQKGCAFEPSLLVMPNGEELTVYNDDQVSHNVNTGQWNVLQAAGAEPFTRAISNWRPVRVGCNIHSWMEGWIYLVQSPFYTVTDETGKFLIEDVPPGKYRVQAWHPSLRSQRETLDFSAGKTVHQEIVFQSPYEG